MLNGDPNAVVQSINNTGADSVETVAETGGQTTTMTLVGVDVQNTDIFFGSARSIARWNGCEGGSGNHPAFFYPVQLRRCWLKTTPLMATQAPNFWRTSAYTQGLRVNARIGKVVRHAIFQIQARTSA